MKFSSLLHVRYKLTEYYAILMRHATIGIGLVACGMCEAAETTVPPASPTPEIGTFLARPAPAAPVTDLGALHWSPTSLDFGLIEWTAKPQQDLTLSNHGTQRVRVHILPSCGCTVAATTLHWLDPGQSVVVPISLRVEEVTGDLRKQVGLTLEVPGKPSVSANVPVTATVHNPLQVVPRVVDFGAPTTGTAVADQTVLITSLEGDLALTGVVGASRFHTEFQVLAPNRRYALVVHPPDPLPNGPLMDRITLASTTPGRADIVILVILRANATTGTSSSGTTAPETTSSGAPAWAPPGVASAPTPQPSLPPALAPIAPSPPRPTP